MDIEKMSEWPDIFWLPRTFESWPCRNQNLTFEQARPFLAKAGMKLDEEEVKSLGLVDRNGSFTNLALIVSDQNPYPVKTGVFEDNYSWKIKVRKDFYGSVLKQMDEVSRWLDEADPGYPRQALQEALTNLIVHRNYEYEFAKISVFEDRMEFVSVGGLPSGIEESDLKSGQSYPPNPTLARLFCRLGLIKGQGTGILNIFSAYEGCKRQPEITLSPNGFQISLPDRNCQC